MILILLGRTLQFALLFVSVKLMTSLLSPEEVGRVTLINTATAFFSLFLINPVGMFFNRRLHAWAERASLRHYFHHYLGYIFLVALLAASCMGSAEAIGLSGQGTMHSTTALLVGGVMFFGTIHQTLVPTLNMLGRLRVFLLLTLATLLVGLLAAWGFSRGIAPTAENWLAGSLLAQGIFALLTYRILFAASPAATEVPIFDSGKIWRLWHFCWPIALAVGFNWLHMQGYRFYLADQRGLVEFGLFAAGYGVATSVIAAFELVLTTRTQPRFYQRINTDDPAERQHAWRSYARVMLPCSIFVITGTMATADDLARLFLGPAFHGVGHFILLGAIAEGSRMICNVLTLYAHAEMETRSLIVPNLVGAGVCLSGALALTPSAGLEMAPISVTLGSLAILACLTAQNRALLQQVYAIRKPLLTHLFSFVALYGAFEQVKPIISDHIGTFPSYAQLGTAGILWACLAALLWHRTIKEDQA